MPNPHDATARWCEVAELDSNDMLDVFAGDSAMGPVETIARAYIKDGKHAEGTVGPIFCHLFDARDIAGFGIRYLEDRFA